MAYKKEQWPSYGSASWGSASLQRVIGLVKKGIPETPKKREYYTNDDFYHEHPCLSCDVSIKLNLKINRLVIALSNPHGEGNGNPLQYPYLVKSHGQRSLIGYTPWGRKRVRHDLETNDHLSPVPYCPPSPRRNTEGNVSEGTADTFLNKNPPKGGRILIMHQALHGSGLPWWLSGASQGFRRRKLCPPGTFGNTWRWLFITAQKGILLASGRGTRDSSLPRMMHRTTPYNQEWANPRSTVLKLTNSALFNPI